LEGDDNTKIFHSIVRGRRSKLHIQREGNWIQGEDNIGTAAVDFYQNLFAQDNCSIYGSSLNNIPQLATQEVNEALTQGGNFRHKS